METGGDLASASLSPAHSLRVSLPPLQPPPQSCRQLLFLEAQRLAQLRRRERVRLHARPPVTKISWTSRAYRSFQDTGPLGLQPWELTFSCQDLGALGGAINFKHNILKNRMFFFFKNKFFHPCHFITKENNGSSSWRTWKI